MPSASITTRHQRFSSARALGRVALTALAAVSLIPGKETLAQASDWPSRVVTVIGPYAPGGNNDIMARMASDYFSKVFKQRFIVENRAGASGALATAHVAQSAPDGYTLLFAASPQIGMVPYIQKVSYDPIKDLAPISAFGSGPFILAINASLPVDNVEAFVNYARTRQINYGSAGPGTVGHLSGALFVVNNK